MAEIAHGIDDYYENSKYCVHFADGSKMEYQLGGMLFELISDDVFYLMVIKPENMIKCFPDSDVPITVESVTNGFKWLYGTVEDEDFPLATELFRIRIHQKRG